MIGTPDDAIALIERLQAKQGEFGVFLHQAHNWADWEATKRSYELYARYVMPHFSGDNIPRIESFDWCTEHRDELTEKRSAAARAMFDKHEAEQRAAREAAHGASEGGARGLVTCLTSSSSCSTIPRPRARCSARRGGLPNCAARRGSTLCWCERRPKQWCRQARKC